MYLLQTEYEAILTRVKSLEERVGSQAHQICDLEFSLKEFKQIVVDAVLDVEELELSVRLEKDPQSVNSEGYAAFESSYLPNKKEE